MCEENQQTDCACIHNKSANNIQAIKIIEYSINKSKFSIQLNIDTSIDEFKNCPNSINLSFDLHKKIYNDVLPAIIPKTIDKDIKKIDDLCDVIPPKNIDLDNAIKNKKKNHNIYANPEEMKAIWRANYLKNKDKLKAKRDALKASKIANSTKSN